MPGKPNSYWSKGRRNQQNKQVDQPNSQKQQQRQPHKIMKKSRSDLRRILHDKLEWNENTSALNMTMIICADEVIPAEAELIVISSGHVASTTRYVRSDIVEAQRRLEKLKAGEESTSGHKNRGHGDGYQDVRRSIDHDDELFRYDPSSKTHKCKVLNQIARSVQKAWCGLLFVPAYQLGQVHILIFDLWSRDIQLDFIAQATCFIRGLNPKPEASHYVDGYISRLCCLEDLLWALRSARGLLNVEPPLSYSIWSSLREEDMAQLGDYSDLTCTCVISTLQERQQAPPRSLLAVNELWPSVLPPCTASSRVQWVASPPHDDLAIIDHPTDICSFKDSSY